MGQDSKQTASVALGFTASVLLALANSYFWSVVALAGAVVLLAVGPDAVRRKLYYCR